MTSLFLVLFAIISTINITNYIKVAADADKVVEYLLRNGGSFQKNDDIIIHGNKEFSKETPFETRYFAVTLYKDDVKHIDCGSVAAIDYSTAASYAQEVVKSKKSQGYMHEYRYGIKQDRELGLIVFVDCAKQIGVADSFLIISTLISIVAMAAIWLLLTFMSKSAVDPVVKTYNKQKEFITNASHELKTPLAIIMANNEILEMEYGENESTQSISKQVRRMGDMVRKLTSMARLSESMVLNNTKIDLTSAICDIIQTFETLAKKRDRKLNHNVEENLYCYGDEGMIRQLIELLLENAIKYSKTEINFTAFRDKNKIVLELSNDCEWIENGDLKKYFERFFRSDITRASNIEGSGIGLTMAQEIVNQHKGKISAKGFNNNIFKIKIIL